LWPNRRHGGIGTYPPDTQFYWLHFYVDKIDRSRRSSGKITLPQTGTPRRPARLFELFHRYLHEFQGGFSPGIAADLLTCEILLEAGTIQGPGVRQEDGSLAAKAKAVIDAGFHRPLGLENLASSLGYSVDYVRNKFKSAYGQTPGQYLIQRRVEAARRFLCDRALRIKEVALKCGFGSEQYLSRVFRKHEGISPVEYRSLHSRVHINIH
jgi:AraC-like DNA-binding protein